MMIMMSNNLSKISFALVSTLFFSINANAVNKPKYEIDKCIPNDADYIERCQLKTVKETSYQKEIDYYFYQIGKGKFDKELPFYADEYIKNAKLYCSMKTAYSFTEMPKNQNLISERLAECLISEYKKLGSNLRLFTDTATKTITEQADKILKNK